MTTTPVRRGTRTAVRLHRAAATRGTFPALPVPRYVCEICQGDGDTCPHSLTPAEVTR